MDINTNPPIKSRLDKPLFLVVYAIDHDFDSYDVAVCNSEKDLKYEMESLDYVVATISTTLRELRNMHKDAF